MKRESSCSTTHACTHSMDALGAGMPWVQGCTGCMDALGAGMHWVHGCTGGTAWMQWPLMAIGETFGEVRLVLIKGRNETRGALHTRPSLPRRR